MKSSSHWVKPSLNWAKNLPLDPLPQRLMISQYSSRSQPCVLQTVRPNQLTDSIVSSFLCTIAWPVRSVMPSLNWAENISTHRWMSTTDLYWMKSSPHWVKPSLNWAKNLPLDPLPQRLMISQYSSRSQPCVLQTVRPNQLPDSRNQNILHGVGSVFSRRWV